MEYFEILARSKDLIVNCDFAGLRWDGLFYVYVKNVSSPLESVYELHYNIKRRKKLILSLSY